MQEDCLAPFVVNKSAGGGVGVWGEVMGPPVPALLSVFSIMDDGG